MNAFVLIPISFKKWSETIFLHMARITVHVDYWPQGYINFPIACHVGWRELYYINKLQNIKLVNHTNSIMLIGPVEMTTYFLGYNLAIYTKN